MSQDHGSGSSRTPVISSVTGDTNSLNQDVLDVDTSDVANDKPVLSTERRASEEATNEPLVKKHQRNEEENSRTRTKRSGLDSQSRVSNESEFCTVSLRDKRKLSDLSSEFNASFTRVMETLGTNILKYLSAKDILCSLQYASRSIRCVCINSLPIWREFVCRYSLGPTARYGNELDNIESHEASGVYLLLRPNIVLTPLDEVAHDVLYSMVTGMVSTWYGFLWGVKGKRSLDRNNARRKKIKRKDGVSPFDHVSSLCPPSWTHLQLHWSGRWAVIWRLKFSNSNNIPKARLLVVYPENRAQNVTIAMTQFEKSEFSSISTSRWSDFMVGKIDVRNVPLDGLSQKPQPRFERLNVSIDIVVGLESTSSSDQYSDFIYLWPIEEQDGDDVKDDPSVLLSSPIDRLSKVQVMLYEDQLAESKSNALEYYWKPSRNRANENLCDDSFDNEYCDSDYDYDTGYERISDSELDPSVDYDPSAHDCYPTDLLFDSRHYY